ncbi:hypothetical protein ETB97_008418 [Aspergillus alliaceus]|uniref:Uncharacterized protein n=1 Tax=Petromyces alliaceus TaxID=209559 RepID=A0A8H5ZWS4_PETAA|nr:hypothetical protein ETB97_008418 [Aspergillus burnettii]
MELSMPPAGGEIAAIINIDGLRHIQWYRHLFLTEPRFQILGRLACEYVVDMFSRTEEQRLQYLQQGRRTQAASMDEA